MVERPGITKDRSKLDDLPPPPRVPEGARKLPGMEEYDRQMAEWWAQVKMVLRRFEDSSV